MLPAPKTKVQSPAMLLAALKTPKTTDAALQLLEVHGAKITDEVREGLLAKDPKKQRMSMLERRSQMKSLNSRRGNICVNSQVCIHIRMHICTFI